METSYFAIQHSQSIKIGNSVEVTLLAHDNGTFYMHILSPKGLKVSSKQTVDSESISGMQKYLIREGKMPYLNNQEIIDVPARNWFSEKVQKVWIMMNKEIKVPKHFKEEQEEHNKK